MSNDSFRSGSNVWPWCGTVGVGFLLALVFTLAWYRFMQQPASFNSDHLYCVHLGEDFVQGRDVQGWHLPAAPYLFPDTALVGVLTLFTSDLSVVFLVYAVIHFLLTLAILAWIFRLVGISWRASFTAAGLGLMLLLAVCTHPDYVLRCLLMLSPGSHLSCQLVGLAATALVLNGLKHGFGWPSAILLVLICGWSGLSDQLLVVQFLAPIGAATLLLSVLRLVPIRRALLTLGLLGIAVFLVMSKLTVLTRLGFVPMNNQPAYQMPNLHAIKEFLALCGQAFHHQPLMLTVLCLHVLGGLTALLLWLRRAWRGANVSSLDGPAILFVALVVVLAPVSNAGALIVTKLATSMTLERYLYTWLLLPFLFLAVWPHVLPWRPKLRLLPAVMLAIVAFRVLTFPDPISLDGFRIRYPPLAQALDDMVRKHGRLRGFADYWHARELHYLTHERVEVLPILSWGLPWFHGYNPNAYLDADRHDLTIPDYHFVIVPNNGDPGPDAQHIQARFGKPVEIIPTAGHDIWRYERLENRQLELFLRAQLAQRLVRARPFTTPAEPSELARPKRNLTPSNARGNIQLAREDTLSIRFDRPILGRMLNLAANFADEYELHFLRGGRERGQMRVPAVQWNGAESAYCVPGLQARLVAVPEECRPGGFDEVRVRPRGCSPHFALGHFLVFDEWIPYRSGLEQPHEKYHRYEGETMARLDSPEVVTIPDSSASAGQVRQACASFVGCLAYGPYLPLPPGRYRVEFALKVADNTARDAVAVVDAYAFAGKQCLQSHPLRGVDFRAAGQYQTFSLTFDSDTDLDLVEYRVMLLGKTTVTLDYVDVTCLTPEETSERCEP